MPKQFLHRESMRDGGIRRTGVYPNSISHSLQLWKTKCENYFEMYEIDYYMWVKVATMHIVGRAECWLQLSWEEFCSLIHERFDRE